jgi:hypothetical protein
VPAVEQSDADKPIYVEQLPKLISGEPTALNFPVYRIFSASIGLFISSISGLDLEHSLIFLNLAFGILTLFFIVFYFSKLIKTEHRTLNLLTTLFMGIVFIYSLPVMLLSITYFVDLVSYFFSFVIFYFAIKIFRKPTKLFWVNCFVLIIALILSIMNKEHTLFYLPVIGMYYAKSYNFNIKKILTDKRIIVFLIIALLAVSFYFFQYQYLFSSKKELITNYNELQDVYGIGASESSKSYVHVKLVLDQIMLKVPPKLNPNYLFWMVISLISTFGVFWIFILGYLKNLIISKNIHIIKKISSVTFFSFLIFMALASAIIINLGFKYQYYILAPYFTYLAAKGFSQFIKKKYKQKNISRFKLSLFIIIISCVVNLLLVFTYIVMHNLPIFK